MNYQQIIRKGLPVPLEKWGSLEKSAGAEPPKNADLGFISFLILDNFEFSEQF